MNYLQNLLVLGLLASLIACQKNEEPIAHHADYATYLNNTEDTSLKNCETEMAFWESRLSDNKDDEVSILKLASLHASRFQLRGEVEDLKISDSLYWSVLEVTPFGKSEIYQALAANSITQHEFRQAKNYIDKALAIGDSKDGSYYMLADVSLELGDLAGAKRALKKFVNKNSFAYLIREAKVKDHEGDLDSAILLMEKAWDRIKENKSIALWTKSNLADMYGHAGRIKEAYRAYLEVLKLDPNYDYALKGIAWVAFSHDHNLKEAKQIAQFLQSKKELPDMHLLLAEIAEFEHNSEEKARQLKLFTEKARQSKYHHMYDKYLAILTAEDLSNPEQSIAIAKEEIRNRPTPQSYDLLAWGYFHLGQNKRAAEVARQYVEGKTFEPEVIYHLGMIYKNIDKEKSRELLKEASNSSFELGPAIAVNIQRNLK